MSDSPQGAGWWQASDHKWYAPELHPDNQVAPAQPAQPPATFQPPQQQGPHFPPPQAIERVPNPSFPPPGQQLGHPGQQLYPTVGKKRSTGKILAIVFGVGFLLLAGGCSAFVWIFREEIGDATVDFSGAEVASDSASCAVTGVGFAEDYELETTLTASSADVVSHYEIHLRVLSASGVVLGSEFAVLRDVEPGETRTEDVFNAIEAADAVHLTSCEVTSVLRVDA